MLRRAPASVSAFFVLAISAAACSSCRHDDSPLPVDAAPPLAEPPVPAPFGLAAEVYLSSPDASWLRLQRSVGGAAAILPASFAGVVLAFSGVDPAVASEVDGSKPAFAVVAEGAAAKDRSAAAAMAPPSWALAMRLTNARHTNDALLHGDVARYAAKAVGPGIRALSSKTTPLTLAVALADSGWLLVASSEEDLEALAPYAYRTLPAKPSPGDAALYAVASHDALAGPLRVRLATLWNQEKSDLLSSAELSRDAHDGGAPDFADPAAIVAVLDASVQHRLDLLGDLAEARLSLDTADDDVHVEVMATPAKGGGPAMKALAGMAPGDTMPLLALPGDALVGLMVRDAADARAADAEDMASSVERALGGRLTPDDGKRLHDGLGGWAKARGDWMTAWIAGRTTASAVVRAPLATAGDGGADGSAAATRSIQELVALTGRPALLGPLGAALNIHDVSFGTTDVPGDGKASLATFNRASPTHGPPPLPLGLGWLADGGEVRVAGSVADAVGASLAAAKKPATTLADDPVAARLLGALGSNVTFAVFAQPTRGSAGAAPPAVFAWGKKGDLAWARADVAPTLLRALLQMLAGL